MRGFGLLVYVVLLLVYWVVCLVGAKEDHTTLKPEALKQVSGAKKSITPKFEKKLVLRLPDGKINY